MVEIITDKLTMISGAFISLLAYLLGDHWVLFAAFLLLNVADYITGTIRSRLSKTVSSKKGLDGILKKIMYWVLIALGFGLSIIFMEIGKVIGLDLGFTSLIGWFVLATLIVNEIRSILENFVEAGFKVPKILIKGLAVAEKAIDEVTDASIPSMDENSKEEGGDDV